VDKGLGVRYAGQLAFTGLDGLTRNIDGLAGFKEYFNNQRFCIWILIPGTGFSQGWTGMGFQGRI